VGLVSQFFKEPASKDMPTAIEDSYALRETINTQFDKELDVFHRLG